jgi:hypothetical protein
MEPAAHQEMTMSIKVGDVVEIFSGYGSGKAIATGKVTCVSTDPLLSPSGGKEGKSIAKRLTRKGLEMTKVDVTMTVDLHEVVCDSIVAVRGDQVMVLNGAIIGVQKASVAKPEPVAGDEMIGEDANNYLDNTVLDAIGCVGRTSLAVSDVLGISRHDTAARRIIRKRLHRLVSEGLAVATLGDNTKRPLYRVAK